MNARIEKLKESLFVDERPLCVERTRYFTEAFRNGDGKPLIVRRAEGFANVLDKRAIFIEDGELIVGNVASKPMGVELNPIRGYWVGPDKLEQAEVGQEFFRDRNALGGVVEGITISDEDMKEIREINEYWMAWVKNDTTHLLITDEAYRAAEAFICVQLALHRIGMGSAAGGVMGQGAYTGMGLGNLMSYVLVHEKHLKYGLNKIVSDAEQELENLDLGGPNALKKANFLRAVIIAHKAAIRFAKRFAALATELAIKEPNHTRKKELEKIASICDWVLANPPRSFHEACQAYWFVTLLGHPSHTAAPGRFDQYMYPFYKKDMEEGRITKEEALDLLACLRVKHSQLREIWETENYRLGYPGAAMFQNTTLGGLTPTGKDATNELSYLILEAALQCPTTHPTLSVRVHEKTPDDFMMKALQVVKTGLGMPAFYGEKAYIQYWLNEGVPLKIARDWALGGCVYSSIPKYSGEISGNFINYVKVFEVTLNNGLDPRIGKQVGPKTGDFESFASFEDFWGAFRKQFEYFTRIAADVENIQILSKVDTNSQPFLTPLMFDGDADPIKTGNDISEGKGPIELVCLNAIGVINVADSLSAIKKLVFDEKKVTKTKLKEALAANWEGYEEIRRMCMAAPKYGNDADYVDSIAEELYRLFVEQCHSIEGVRKGTLRKKAYFLPDAFSVAVQWPAGRTTGATPDGRYAGECLADGSMSAMRGRDTNGPTALIKSAGKIDQIPYGCTLLNMKFHPSSAKSTEDLKKMADLIKTYLVDFEGKHVQFNVVDKETLLAAQAHPEDNRDLVVRVAGYSAYFVQLSKAVQDEIIGRTELSL
jgi:pyruvate formate-lyase/glycerol dehydratase family glycyl radical enzyme